MNMVAVVVALVAIYFSYQGYQSYWHPTFEFVRTSTLWIILLWVVVERFLREKQAATPIQLPVETLLP